MAYVGFSQLCQFMWNSSDTSLNIKPETWINELIQSLQSDSLTHLLSITRRSAGLPFYCQVKYFYSLKYMAFDFCFCKIFLICQNYSSCNLRLTWLRSITKF